MLIVHAAVTQRDGAALARATHALKGAIANLTTGRAFKAAVSLENMAKNGKMEPVQQGCTDLDTELRDLSKALLQFTAGMPCI